VRFGEQRAPNGVRMQHRTRSEHANHGQVELSLVGWLAVTANRATKGINPHNLLSFEQTFIRSAGRDGQPERIPADEHAEIPARSQQPASPGKVSAELGEKRDKIRKRNQMDLFSGIQLSFWPSHIFI